MLLEDTHAHRGQEQRRAEHESDDRQRGVAEPRNPHWLPRPRRVPLRRGRWRDRTLEDQLRIGEGETTPDREFTLETVACLGCCSLAPVVMINKDTHANLKPVDLRKVLKPYREKAAAP